MGENVVRLGNVNRTQNDLYYEFTRLFWAQFNQVVVRDYSGTSHTGNLIDGRRFHNACPFFHSPGDSILVGLLRGGEWVCLGYIPD